tara:strand:- start:11620 stop:13203 length:1584 start_codon:yes stop_codon:yes gene_type:complete
MKKSILLLLVFVSSFSWAQQGNFTIKNLKANKKFEDFGTAYYGDSTVVFSSARYDVFMKRVWSGNHQPFLSLYQGTLSEKGELVDVKPFGKKIDSKYHESNLVFTKDGRTVYFSRNNYYQKQYKKDSTGVNLIQIYKAKVDENGHWSDIERLSFNDDNYDSGHPALNKDETKLYFVSNMLGSFGKTDIYEVDILDDGSYGKVKNLGLTINTSQREMFPFVDENNVLYFSSDGHQDNRGELDIYASKKDRKGNYFEAINLGFPLNSDQDDFAFVKQQGKSKGYFSSNRKGGKGDDDIYSFVEITPITFECPEIIKGKVINAKDNKSVSFSTVTLYSQDEQLASMITGEDGEYQFNVECKSEYKIVATKKNFNQDVKDVLTEDDGEILVNLSLQPEANDHFIEKQDQVMLNIKPIYFDTAKATIKPESIPELQLVADLMKKYPKIIVQIRAHTDSRGNDKYNMNLSNERAITAMQWIVKKGTDKNRIFAAGFGESELLNECRNEINCSDEKHEINRRIDFVILNPDTIR